MFICTDIGLVDDNEINKERLTIKSQPRSGGEKEMAQKRYSKAEVLSDPCWLFK